MTHEGRHHNECTEDGVFSERCWETGFHLDKNKVISHTCVPVFSCVGAQLLQSCRTVCDPVDCSPQAPLSMGFSRRDYWRGLPCPPPGDLTDPGIEPESVHLLHRQWALYHEHHQGNSSALLEHLCFYHFAQGPGSCWQRAVERGNWWGEEGAILSLHERGRPRVCVMVTLSHGKAPCRSPRQS